MSEPTPSLSQIAADVKAAFWRGYNSKRSTTPPVDDVAPPRSCRVCGCTDADCSACVAATGAPCSWVAPDLCSACDPSGVLEAVRDAHLSDVFRWLNDNSNGLRVAIESWNGGEPELVVDALALMRDDCDVRYWILSHAGEGLWTHGPSGMGPLGLEQHLRSIALVYMPTDDAGMLR